jgi:hypothetical protein
LFSFFFSCSYMQISNRNPAGEALTKYSWHSSNKKTAGLKIR